MKFIIHCLCLLYVFNTVSQSWCAAVIDEGRSQFVLGFLNVSECCWWIRQRVIFRENSRNIHRVS